MVICYQNCSDLLWEKKCSSEQEDLVKFKAGGQEFAKILRSIEQFIQTVKGQNNFWKQNVFLTYSWRFLIANELEQLLLLFKKVVSHKWVQD